MVKRADESMTGRDGVIDDGSAVIRSDIERTRGDMSRTVNEIEERLSPSHIKEQVGSIVSSELRQAKSAVRDATVGRVEHMVQDARESVTTAGTTVLDTVRANPIPASLIGIGLGWLLMSARRQRSSMRYDRERDRPMRRYRAGAGERYGYRTGYGLSEGTREDRDYGRGSRRGRRQGQRSGVSGAMRAASEEVSNVGERVQDAASGAMESAQAKAHEIGEKVSHLAEDAKGRATHLAGDARDRGRRVARDAREQFVRAERSIESSFRDNPLAVSAVALAIGAAIGLSLPHTDVEDEWMGDARDRILSRAEDVASDAIQGAEQKVTQLASGAQGEHQGEPQPQQGLTQNQAQQGSQDTSPDSRNGIGGGTPSSRSV